MPNPSPNTKGLVQYSQVNRDPVYVSVQIERSEKELLDAMNGGRSHNIRQAIKEYLRKHQ